jgi:hypothetical protein
MLNARATSSAVPKTDEKEAGAGIGDKAAEVLGDLVGKTMKSAMRQAANQLGRHIVRGLMGSLLGGKKR